MNDRSGKMRLSLGILIGIVFAFIVIRFPEMIRFLHIDPFVFLGAGGIFTGFVAGNKIKGGAKAGFLAGIVPLIVSSVAGLISDPDAFLSLNILQFIAGLLDLIIIITVPMAAGGAVGGWICQVINRTGV